MNNIKIAAIQNDIIWENINNNLNSFSEIISSIDNVDIIILPEMFNSGFTNNLSIYNDSSYKKTIFILSDLSVKKNTAICASIIVKENNSFFNRFIFIDNNGNLEKYDKRHLFAIGGENDLFTPGKSQKIINYKGVKIFPQICYDLRFPVWSRNVFNYDLLIYVANWPSTRRKHWDCLLEARAIENQSYVVGVNRIGKDGNNINYDGGTKIIDYNGNIISEAIDNNKEIIYGELSIEKQNIFREFFPSGKDADNFIILNN